MNQYDIRSGCCTTSEPVTGVVLLIEATNGISKVLSV